MAKSHFKKKEYFSHKFGTFPIILLTLHDLHGDNDDMRSTLFLQYEIPGGKWIQNYNDTNPSQLIHKFKVGFLFSPCFPLFCILTVTWLAFFQFSWFTDVIWSTPMWVSVGHFTGPNVEIKNYQLFASVNSRWKPPQVKSLFWSGTKSECKDCLTRKVTKGRRD